MGNYANILTNNISSKTNMTRPHLHHKKSSSFKDGMLHFNEGAGERFDPPQTVEKADKDQRDVENADNRPQDQERLERRHTREVEEASQRNNDDAEAASLLDSIDDNNEAEKKLPTLAEMNAAIKEVASLQGVSITDVDYEKGGTGTQQWISVNLHGSLKRESQYDDVENALQELYPFLMRDEAGRQYLVRASLNEMPVDLPSLKELNEAISHDASCEGVQITGVDIVNEWRGEVQLLGIVTRDSQRQRVATIVKSEYKNRFDITRKQWSVDCNAMEIAGLKKKVNLPEPKEKVNPPFFEERQFDKKR